MPNQRPPNILLTIADDQRFDLLSCLGHPDLRTPALDRLAARGACFTHAHHLGAHHGAVCAPSRAMLHTGRTLFHIPNSIKTDWPKNFPEAEAAGVDPRSLPLLGELLQQRGYDCLGVGKWHNERDSFARSFTGGARIFYHGMCSHFAVPYFDFDPSGQYPSDSAHVGSTHSVDLFADAAIAMLRARRPDDPPFFLYCAFTAPHDPRETLPRFHQMYDPARLALPGNCLPDHPFDNGALHIRDEELAAHPRNPEEIRRHIADYYAITSHMDEGIGRIHAALEQAGLLDNTLVVHTADHGLAVGQHGLMGKQNLYEHSVRVPLLLAGPGIAAGQRRGQLVYQHDLYPTLLEAAGAAIPAACEFTSLQPLLQRGDAPGRASIFTTYDRRQRMVRQQRYKLIACCVAGVHHLQLFDLEHDPLEMHNLAANPTPAQRQIIERLAQEMRRWQRQVDDPIDVLPAGIGVGA